MAPLLTLEDIRLRQAGRWLLDGLSLAIQPKDRLALVGRNGAGKSTLLRLLAGLIEPDAGRRIVSPRTRIALIEQEPDFSGFARLVDWALAGPDAPLPHALEAAAQRLEVDLARPCDEASGGERRRAALARALAQAPDLLLLDEPTNHLDIRAIARLETWLERFGGAFVVVSHDRAFLTRLTRACLWLDQGVLRRREVGFGGFEAWAEEVEAEAERAAARLDTRLGQETRWLARGVTARRRRNRGRLARLASLRAERRALLGARVGRPALGLATDERRARRVLEAEGVWLTHGGRVLVRDLSLEVLRGDRIGLVGPNGAGKTTLLRLLMGEIPPDRGQIHRAQGLVGITIDQQRRLLDPARRVRDVLCDGGDWLDVRGERRHARAYLKDFLFHPDVLDAPVGSLSGGERARLLLAREFARRASLLVLDEPTNDLDLETLDLLQEVVAEFDGTVLVASHDRDFLDRTVTMTLFLDGSGRVEVVAGGWSDLARQLGRDPWADAAAQPTGNGPVAVPRPTRSRPAAGAARAARAEGPRLGYREWRELERLPEAIARHEVRIAELERALADPALWTRERDRAEALARELEATRAALAADEERWLALAALAETAEAT
ncbi:MAG: ATP-binding cassette domain-containing protein [Sphingomonadaceae bacterium]|uniref:ABC-F family ATP-binding cassette domain-containing protein n=1 Tax=Thermaurantiacus sp. TaxID=2820283 RepID=UPI00298EEA64|nr:ATP-binding cassette domain-containing protein [Thermaurantiacus sp.]MCS6986496.1 ATP-binding cassette domain-containing protein [Sphingomonadaceae bacterium]MDW8414243.1 ATP-binding cassette domain-containing protein [Thermaurantiacus sp.]